jgi:hypothetical protein
MAFTINLPGIIPSLEDFKKSAPIGISALGTPIFDNVEFIGGNYINNEGDAVEYAGLILDAVKVTVTQSKNIVTTEVAGKNGTVKEYMSLGDYVININAKISELYDVFPADQMQAWKGLANCPERIDVLSKFLNQYFDVTSVVLKDFDTNPVVGSLNEVELNMVLLSDEEIDLNSYVS